MISNCIAKDGPPKNEILTDGMDYYRITSSFIFPFLLTVNYQIWKNIFQLNIILRIYKEFTLYQFSPYFISGTVIELSAIFVDNIIFLNPGLGGSNTLYCSSLVMEECSGIIFSLCDSVRGWRSSSRALISARPGRKIKTQPLFWAKRSLPSGAFLRTKSK